MFSRATDRLRKIEVWAIREASRLGHDHIGTEHLLIGFLKEESGVGAFVAKELGVDLQKALEDVNATMIPGTAVIRGSFLLSPMAKQVVGFTHEEADEMNRQIPGSSYVGSEHLLLGMLRQPECRAAVVLMKHGVKIGSAREKVRKVLGIGERQ